MTIDHWHTTVFSPDSDGTVRPVLSPAEPVREVAITYTLKAIKAAFTDRELTEDAFLSPMKAALPEFAAGRLREMPFCRGLVTLWSCERGDPCQIGYNAEILRIKAHMDAQGARIALAPMPEGWQPTW